MHRESELKIVDMKLLIYFVSFCFLNALKLFSDNFMSSINISIQLILIKDIFINTVSALNGDQIKLKNKYVKTPTSKKLEDLLVLGCK